MTTSRSEYAFLTFTAALLAVFLLEASPLQAQEEQQQEQTQPTQEGRQRHIVRTGDTLWDLAEFYLTDPFLWPEIYRLNTMVVEDPHWIYPDEELVLPGEGDIGREVPGEGLPGEGEEVVVRPPEPEIEPGELTIQQQETPTIFVDRELSRRTLTYQREPPPPPIAVSQFDFHRSGVLLSIDELGPRGEVIEPAVERATVNVMGDYLDITRYSPLYVSHPGGEPPQLGDQMILYHIDREVKGYGHIIVPTGMVTVVDVHDHVSIVVVTELYGQIDIGDFVALAQRFDTRPGVMAEPVATGPSGELVAMLIDQSVPSVEDIIFIDIGRDQGIVEGDEFEIYAPMRQSRSGYTLPEGRIATARAVRTTQSTTTLRVLRQLHPAIIVGLPVRLVAKMPSS